MAVFAGAALLGGVLGWGGGARQGDGKEVSSIAAERGEGQRAKWRKEDFLKALPRVSPDRKDFNPLTKELADWTDEELRAALEASLTHPDCLLPGDPAEWIPRFLMAEWMRRDFDAALAWFEGLEPGKSKEKMTMAVVVHWPEERGEEGFEYLLANRELLSRWSSSLVINAFQGRVNDGAAAVLDFMHRLGEEGQDFPFGIDGIKYPPGFDFPALVGSDEFAGLKELGGGAYSGADWILCAWHMQDREAAYDWLMANRGVGALDKIAGNHRVNREENLAWLAGKFEAMDGSEREEFGSAVLEKWIRFPDMLRHFAGGLKEPALLDEIRGIGVQSIFVGEVHGAMPLLEEMKPARRIELLENAEPGPAFSGVDRHYRHFTETDEALLRRKLAEWQAGEEQIERIVSRFKP